jgi:hypothetical protein
MDNKPETFAGFAIGFLLTMIYEIIKEYQKK